MIRYHAHRGVKTWHIALPAAVGAISIPVALYYGFRNGKAQSREQATPHGKTLARENPGSKNKCQCEV
jgi:hypothetical protein